MKKLNFSFANNEKPEKGSVLISDPFLNDPYYGRSVVVLCEHNQDGTFGFVLNNYLDTDKASIPFWGMIALIVAIDIYHSKNLLDSHTK